jgi:hypothetical protein
MVRFTEACRLSIRVASPFWTMRTLRQLLDRDLSRLLKVEDTLLQPIHGLAGVLVVLRRHHVGAAALAGHGLDVQVGEGGAAVLLGEGLAGGDVAVELHNAGASLVVEAVQHGDVAAEAVNAALQLDGDLVDLAGDGLELGAEHVDAAAGPRRTAWRRAGLLHVGGVEAAGLGNDLRQ